MEKPTKEKQRMCSVEEDEAGVEDVNVHMGEMLLQIDGVTLQEIHGQERTAVLEDAELVVVSYTPTDEEVQQAGLEKKPLVFVLVGNYKIPLCNTVPILQSSPTDFVFAVPKLFLGVVLPNCTDMQVIDAFEILLKTYGVLRQRPAPKSATAQAAPPSTASRAVALGAATAAGVVAVPTAEKPLSTRIASGIGKASTVAVQGIRKGTELLKEGLGKGSQKIVEHTDACEKPMEISESTKSHIAQARTMTKSAVVLTGGLATAMVTVAGALGNQIAGRIGSHVSAKTGNDPRLEAVKEVGSAAVGAVSTILVETSDAVRVLLTATADGASKIVTHKLGAEAGVTASEGLGVLTDAYAVQNNLKTVGLRAVAKTTAKTAAAQLLEDDPPPTKQLPPPEYDQ